MIDVGPCLCYTLDSVVLRRRARSQPVELRKDVPHPMGLLPAAPDFRERCLIVRFLRAHETVQVVRIVRGGGVVCVSHALRATSYRLPATSYELRATSYQLLVTS